MRIDLEFDPLKWYTISELVSLGRAQVLPVKARTVWTQLMRSGAIACMNKGSKLRPVYTAKGSAILEWINNNLITN